MPTRRRLARRAAWEAANTIRQRMVAFAAEHFGVAATDIEFADGNVRIAKPGSNQVLSFGELAKLTGLSAGVLVVIIAIGAAIKPLSDGLLDAGDAALFVSLAMVPMLAFVLPFAAGFASTLTYHRLATSNETTAAYASGISHRAVLVPAAVMGLVLALVVSGLNEQVIPRFLLQMQRRFLVILRWLLNPGSVSST